MAKSKSIFEQYIEDPNNMRLFQQERAIYEVTAMIESLMKDEGVGRSELAKRLGRSKGWVTQLLDGEANKTFRTVADVFAVLGYEYCSSYRRIQFGNNQISSSPTQTLTAELRIYQESRLQSDSDSSAIGTNLQLALAIQ